MRSDKSGRKARSAPWGQSQQDGVSKTMEPTTVWTEPGWSADTDDPEEIRLPLRIEDTMAVRAPAAPARIATCKIVGAVHGKFILITEPAIKINDRVAEVLDGNLLCSCLCDDYLYIFYSRYRNRVMGDIVSIEYPRNIEVRRIRKYTRIKVDIATKVSFGKDEPVSARMIDISRGGCRLAFDQRVRVTKASILTLAFELPNEITVESIEAVVQKIKRIKKITEIGLSFNTQTKESAKIADFCEICSFVCQI